MLDVLAHKFGEVIQRAGIAFAEQGDDYRAQYGNPRDPERNMFDHVGDKLKAMGGRIIDFANIDEL